jgi:PAS domain-containing protein
MAPTIDFRRVFETVPGLFLLLRPDRDFTIVGASDEYLHATFTEREAIVGRALFDVFPDNPDDPKADGVEKLRASLERVLAGKAADHMATQKYDVRRPGTLGGGFVERYWSPVNTPVLADDGTIELIVHRVEDATGAMRI